MFVISLWQVVHASYNVTTNERINHKRYDYLKDGKGRFYNPFNKGIKHNLLEFLHLRRPPREDEMEFLGISIVWQFVRALISVTEKV